MTEHCPGLESNKSLQSVEVKCPNCGKVNEIFSDELNKQHKCSSCSTVLKIEKAA